MRFTVLSAILCMVGLAEAGASCLDTLKLSSLTVSRQTLHNSATLGTWTSKVLTKFDAISMADAMPLGLPASVHNPDAAYGTALHFTRIVTDTCSDGAVTPVEFWRVTDSFREVPVSGMSRIGTVEFGTDDIPVRRVTDRYFQVGGKPVLPKNYWSSDLFDVGLIQDGDTIGAWSVWFIGRTFRKVATTGIGIPVADAVTYKLFALQTDNSLATALAAFQASVDSIGSGEIDSTRFDVVKFRYSYATTLPTGVMRRADRGGFAVDPVGNGWRITLPVATAVDIVSLDGRIVCRLGAGQTLFWDGRDASGASLRSGVWYARAHGLGAEPILVR